MDIKQIKPLQVDIEVSSRCNLRCKGCPINYQSDRGRFMDLDLFKSIVDRINWDCTLVPWLNGEPLLHPDYTEMIKYITKADKRAYITTNGMQWNEELFQHITEPNSIYQIIFSLDGLPHEFSRSIELARPGSNRKTILGTIERFLELREKKGKYIDVAVKICERGQDYEEIENYIYYWLKRGVSYVCVGKMLDAVNDSEMRIYPCRYSDNMFMVIRVDGEVVACSYHPVAHNENYFGFGNVRNDTPLLEIYNNEKMQKFREDQKQGIFRGPCRNCGFAYTGDGFKGMVKFRNAERKEMGWVSVHYDYYNTFYSLRPSLKPDQFYGYHQWDEISQRLSLGPKIH
jgi:radical SAM protein with 4Fe4S-binding SPASM domain